MDNNYLFNVFLMLVFSLISVFSVKIQQTDDVELAQTIFQEHGVNTEVDLFRRLDDKTSRIFGDIVCEKAAKQKYGTNKVEFDSWRKIYVAKSIQNALYCTASGFKTFAVLSGPDSFYYLGPLKTKPNKKELAEGYHEFMHQKNRGRALPIMRINDCLKIIINLETDLKKIKVQEVKHYNREADHIFRVFGTLPLYRIVPATQIKREVPSHVCAIAGPKNKKKDICKKAFQKINSKFLVYKPINDIEPECGNVPIAGHFDRVTVSQSDDDHREIATTDVLMLKCWYKSGGSPSVAIYIGVVNVNTPVMNDYYYIATQGKNHYYIQKCFKLN